MRSYLIVQRNELRSIQFLRFIAATIVVFGHSTGAIPNSVASVQKFIGLGASGVSIFFVISGFVMFHTSFGEHRRAFSAKEFLTRRIARIYPIYMLYCALYLSFYQLFGEPQRLSGAEIGGSLLLLPGYSSSIIGPGWTLSFEMYFYICFAIFMSIGMRAGLVSMTIFFVAAIALRAVVIANDPVVHLLTNPLLIEFLLGAWIAYFIKAVPKMSSALGYIAVSIALVGFTVGIYFGYTRWPALLVWGFPSGFLIGGLVILERNNTATWIVRKLAPLGDSSYSLYLLHILLIDLFFITVAGHFDVSGIAPVPLALLVTFLCGMVAHGAYYCVERHLTVAAQNMMRRWFL